MNEWAAKLLSVFPERSRADLDQYLLEVNNDQAEHMYLQGEFDAAAECCPTFEQVSMETILDELNENIMMIKAFESLLQDRSQGFMAFNSSLIKTKSAFEVFDRSKATLRLSLDSLFVYIEQEIQWSRNHVFLSDLRRSLLEMRSEAVRKMMDYQRELQQADKDVAAAEKKLAKSKEQLDRMLDNRSKLESFEIDIMNPRNIFNRDGKSERVRETEDLVSKCEKEIRSEVRLLLHAIGYKDQLLAASRRAYQKLDAECKRAVAITLQKIVEKEKDYAEVHRNAILKLEQAIEKIDVENDINEFVENNISNDGSVVYSSRALSLLSDLVPQVEISSAISSRAHSPDISDTSSNTGTASTPAVQTPVRKPSFVTNFTKQRKTSKSSILDNSGVFKTVESDDDQEERDSDASTTERKGKANSLFGAVKDFAAKPKVKSPTTTPISPGTNATVSSAVADADKMQEKAKIDSPLSFQISSHLHTIFYTATSSSPTGLSGSIDEEDTQSVKEQHRKARVNKDVEFITLKDLSTNGWLEDNKDSLYYPAVEYLSGCVLSQNGRNAFITELNKYRSKKVNVGEGFDALAAVLWATLTSCQAANDVHTAKVIMMLSQTFYRTTIRESVKRVATGEKIEKDGNVEGEKVENVDKSFNDGTEDEESKILKDSGGDEIFGKDEEDDDTVDKRGTKYRQYIKEKLVAHPLWHDGNYWEQALWQCAIEQLQTIPYEKAWHDMDKYSRNLAVRRVHDVIFSQVMAIAHSMIELGCTREQTREFLYRMCVIHQLSEGQRQQLLAHVLRL